MIEITPSPPDITPDASTFRFAAGTPIRYADAAFAGVAERFCCDVTHQTGLRPELTPDGRSAFPRSAPGVRIEFGADADLMSMPAPMCLTPDRGEDGVPDERYSLTIDARGIVIRCFDPAGAARGLATLVRLIATAPADEHGTVTLPGLRMIEAPDAVCDADATLDEWAGLLLWRN